MAPDDTLLSRSGRSNEGGKLTRRFDIPVSEELEEGVIALAALADVPKAEYLRTILERAIFGELPMLRRMAHRGRASRVEDSPMNGGHV